VRVVLDTNILVSYLITPEGVLSRLIEAWIRARTLEVCSSEWQIDELKRVCRYERIKKLIAPRQVEALVALLRHRAVMVKPRRVPRVSPDRDDDYVISLAIEAGAALLVTGDGDDLLALKATHGIGIITPRALLDRLKRRKKRKDPKGLLEKTKRKPAKK
jgi:uncharacterized protein